MVDELTENVEINSYRNVDRTPIKSNVKVCTRRFRCASK